MTQYSDTLWPFVEAKRILEKIGNKTPSKGYVLFESGYGPSGLPHIGTFCDVCRTDLVRYAFNCLAPNIPTKLFVFSDDYDGMRKAPDNVPNKEDLKNYIGFPLSSIPNPFKTKETTYGGYMNKHLCDFLNQFNFEYDFFSATECYKNGMFNLALKRVAEKHDEIMALMLPTLSPERQATYSPFMPYDEESGKILAEGVIGVNATDETITYKDPKGQVKTISFLNGNCKLQWKPDFGMRWYALGVDYEIYGKDHYPNEPIYRKICKILGSEPPVNYFYELFLDDSGKKISKSKGNGMEVEDWIKYANVNVLSYYLFLKPKTAKKMYFDVVPKVYDTYLDLLERYHKIPSEDISAKSENPIFFVHKDKNLPSPPGVSFSLLLNIAVACNPSNADIFWHFLSKHNKNLIKGKNQLLDGMVESAVRYYEKYVVPNKRYHTPTKEERSYLEALKSRLQNYNCTEDVNHSEEIQALVYGIANDFGLDQKHWFSLIYKSLLGSEDGPRVGSFVSIYGINETILLIEACLEGNLKE